MTPLIKKILKYNPDLKIILVAALYYLAARLGYFLAFQDTTALPAWPPSGIAFALMIILGRSAWPGITIGALVANIMGYWNSQTLDQNTIIIISSFIAIGHTLETLTGNFLVKWWIKDSYPFRNAKDAFRFLFVTLFMCLIGASIGILSLFFNGVIPFEALVVSGFSWWAGNVVGVLLFTPFILAIAQKRKIDFDLKKLIEVGIFVLCIVGVFFLWQMGYSNTTLTYAIPYLLIPLLLWLAFRFSLLSTWLAERLNVSKSEQLDIDSWKLNRIFYPNKSSVSYDVLFRLKDGPYRTIMIDPALGDSLLQSLN